MSVSTPRNRRTKSYWEPIYDPSLSSKFDERSWVLENDRGPTRYTFTAERLEAEIKSAGIATHFKGITFTECDFFGHFDRISRVITFVDCTFLRCDFGLTTWEKTKFTKCRFTSTSLTQATFERCEFREIKWKEIGISGNETRLVDCIFDHPEQFIRAGWTNMDRDVLKAKNKKPSYQRAKLENDKSVISRVVFNGLQSVGTEESFYQASRANLRQQAWTRFWWAIFDFSEKTGFFARVGITVSLALILIELIFINAFGFVNNWGGSVVRPIALLVGVFVIFSIIYWMTGEYDSSSAIAKSFEITSVAGYTKGAALWVSPMQRLIEWINLIFGVGIYTVLFATIVSRICRVR